jgi:hypothetical protein
MNYLIKYVYTKEIDGLQYLYTKDAKAVVTEEKKKNE